MASPRLFKPAMLKSGLTALDLHIALMNIFRNAGGLAVLMQVPEISQETLDRLITGIYERFRTEYGLEPLFEIRRLTND